MDPSLGLLIHLLARRFACFACSFTSNLIIRQSFANRICQAATISFRGSTRCVGRWALLSATRLRLLEFFVPFITNCVSLSNTMQVPTRMSDATGHMPSTAACWINRGSRSFCTRADLHRPVGKVVLVAGVCRTIPRPSTGFR